MELSCIDCATVDDLVVMGEQGRWATQATLLNLVRRRLQRLDRLGLVGQVGQLDRVPAITLLHDLLVDRLHLQLLLYLLGRYEIFPLDFRLRTVGYDL